MGNSFLQRVFSMIMLGFVAACLFWALRHFVLEAIYSNGAGWHDMFEKHKQVP